MTAIIVLCLSLILCPLLAHAQSVTWHQIAIPDPDRPLLPLLLQGLTPDGSLLGQGRLFDFRVAPDHSTVTPITCPNIARDTTQVRLGPLIHAVNALRTVVGDEAIVQGGQVRNAGILQVEGSPDCVLVQRPGAVGTFLRAVNDAGRSAGVSQGPQPSLGLRRFEGFTREPDGTFTPLTGVCNTDEAGQGTAEVLHPEALAVGWLVGYGYCNLQPTNAYRYDAFYCQDGVGCQTLRDPEAHTLWLTAVTNAGLAYGSQATSEHVPQGKAYTIDLNAAPPAFTELPLPPASTPGGTVLSCHPTAAGPHGWVCEGREHLASCPPPENPFANCIITVQWLALADPPAVTPAPLAPEKKGRDGKPEKERRDKERPSKEGKDGRR